MHRIIAVAVNTFREAVRDRVLYGLVGIATAVLVFTLVLAELSLDQQRRIVLDVGLASISLFSVLVAIFLGSSLLYKEIERKTLYVILPKPIRRFEFLLGKYFGIALTALVFVAIQGAVQLCVSTVQAGGQPRVDRGARVRFAGAARADDVEGARSHGGGRAVVLHRACRGGGSCVDDGFSAAPDSGARSRSRSAKCSR